MKILKNIKMKNTIFFREITYNSNNVLSLNYKIKSTYKSFINKNMLALVHKKNGLKCCAF